MISARAARADPPALLRRALAGRTPSPTQLGVHHDTVRRAVERERFIRPGTQVRPSALDPYKAFITATLEQYPRLRATPAVGHGARARLSRLGHPGAALRPHRPPRRPRRGLPAPRHPRRRAGPGRLGQLRPDPRRRRPPACLSCFVLVLSWSRACYARFALDQTLESFLRGHVEAFAALAGRAPHHPLRQFEERRPRARRRSHPLPPAPARARRPLPLRPPAVRGGPRE